jgi:hypothetical protein
MGRNYFPASFGLVAILMLTITAPANGQTSPPNGGKTAPPNAQQNLPGNAGTASAPNPGLCPRTLTMGPYFASDQAELAAQSALSHGTPASAVYQTG